MARETRQEETPSADDPIWQLWSELVLKALSEPRSLEQLKAWAREERFEVSKLVNALAWLDLRGLVKTARVAGALTWVRAPVAVKPPLVPLPRICPRCHGRMHIEPERVACLTCGHSIYPPLHLD